jgi:hypothetical protein
LRVGTNADNTKDRVVRGRSSRLYGALNPAAVLSDLDRKNIKSLYQYGDVTYTDLAGIYRVHYSTIRNVIKGPKKNG